MSEKEPEHDSKGVQAYRLVMIVFSAIITLGVGSVVKMLSDGNVTLNQLVRDQALVQQELTNIKAIVNQDRQASTAQMNQFDNRLQSISERVDRNKDAGSANTTAISLLKQEFEYLKTRVP